MSRLATFRPAFLASALIAAGVMSGVPTMYSRSSEFLTSLRPLNPITIEPIPKAINTMLAATPPYANNLFMMPSFVAPITVRPACPSRRAVSSVGVRIRLRTTTEAALQKVVLERVADELGASRQAQLLHDVGAVCLDRAHREVELLRDLLICVAEGEQP